MTIDVGGVYSSIQGIFCAGVVIVVGSGASCAYGLPGMGELASHLLAEMPQREPHLSADESAEWQRIATRLGSGTGLEEALGPDPLPGRLAEHVADCVAAYVSEAERPAIAAILAEQAPTAFGRLFAYALRTGAVVDVVTTNYDRLLEVHAAKASVRVDTMYYGHTVGRLDPGLSRDELLLPITFAGRRSVPRLQARPHVRLAKPHGSLDWYALDGGIVRCEFDLQDNRKIVAPGANKYRVGYDAPFDAQRNRANSAIDAAGAFFVIGYGFNDDHLQTHLQSRFPLVPAVVVAKELSPGAKAYLATSTRALGIEATDDPSRCRVHQGQEQFELDRPLWQLETIVQEVLNG